jgi:hypothetical protein
MRMKHLLTILIVFVLCTSFSPSKPMATSWAYSFVVWDGYIYVISDEYLTEIGSEIGQVTKYSDMEQFSGNFSNAYKKGTKYYSIEGISTDVAIAIQEDEGKYRKAIREREYTYKGGIFDFSGWFVGVVVLFIVTIMYVYFLHKKVIK